jgi:hypothetical protein
VRFAHVVPIVAPLLFSTGCVAGVGTFYTPHDWPTPTVVVVEKPSNVLFHRHAGVLVHIDAAEPLVLQMEHDGWAVVCLSPCDQWMRAGKKYRIARLDWADDPGVPPRYDHGLPVSHPFHLDLPEGSWAKIGIFGQTPAPPDLVR